MVPRLYIRYSNHDSTKQPTILIWNTKPWPSATSSSHSALCSTGVSGISRLKVTASRYSGCLACPPCSAWHRPFSWLEMPEQIGRTLWSPYMAMIVHKSHCDTYFVRSFSIFPIILQRLYPNWQIWCIGPKSYKIHRNLNMSTICIHLGSTMDSRMPPRLSLYLCIALLSVTLPCSTKKDRLLLRLLRLLRLRDLSLFALSECRVHHGPHGVFSLSRAVCRKLVVTSDHHGSQARAHKKPQELRQSEPSESY